MSIKYKSSADLVVAKSEVADEELERRKLERDALLMREYIAVQMESEIGQQFFHRLIFEMTVPSVGVVGLFDQNPNVNVYREGLRCFQSAIHGEVRSVARPSDYADMLMRPLGGKRPETIPEEERMK